MPAKESLPRFVDDITFDGAPDRTCDVLAEAQTGGQSDETGFRLLPAGDEAFLARAWLIARSQRTLDLQYYLFSGDTSGALLSNSILQAADRGVRVRLLVDGWSLVWRDAESVLLNMHPNVEIRLFNPLAAAGDGPVSRLVAILTNAQRVNRRMHNKVFIADGKLVVIGGRNVDDRYFGFSEDFGFRDLDVLCSGALVKDICGSFDAYWNSTVAKTLRSAGIRNRSVAEFARFRSRLAGLRRQRRISRLERRLSQTRLAHRLAEGQLGVTWAQARLIVDPPDKVAGAAPQQASPLEQLVAMAQSVSRELLLVSPYFVPGERGMSVLTTLRSRGIRIVLVTNSLASTDIPLVHAGYRQYRGQLLDIGVEIHEIKPSSRGVARLREFLQPGRASLHAKAYVFDRSHVVLGSLNLDPRSMMLNTEIGVLVSNVLFAEQVAEYVRVLASDEHSYRLRLVGESSSLVWDDHRAQVQTRHLREPKANLWRRLIVRFLSLLPIEDQL
ncbi:MAG: phospholipase D family protein [Betaproteobacteria bacterium]|nr:MAG: phospholipase D family protein [Betaproteobacteria bacterium]